MAAQHRIDALCNLVAESRDVGAFAHDSYLTKASQHPELVKRIQKMGYEINIEMGPTQFWPGIHDLQSLISGEQELAHPFFKESAGLELITAFRDRTTCLSSRRRLFTTSCGRLLGNGPLSLSPGDEVWILSGAKVPMVLRPR
jgi:hypothetical protein